MAPLSHVAVAMAASFLLLLLGFQLVSTLGIAAQYENLFKPAVHRSYGAKIGNDQIPFTEGELKKERDAGSQYLIGVGKGDITGPVVELEFMGYADLNQIGTGLRQRLYSRTFIVGDPNNKADRFVYMVLDTQSGDTAIRNGILEGVAALGSDYSVYGQSNIAVTGTHSHSGPAAWLNYLLPTITSKGFDKQSYQAIVDGAVLSVKRAHESLTTGTLSYGTVPLDNANINRSPYAYMANPADERAKYTADVDKTMDVLKLTRSSDGKDIGIFTWFPVHGTSMLGNNTLASGDNKGVAADMFEKSVKSNSNAAPGFVAGFSQANVGDTSPNTEGAWCEDGTNVQCSYERSLCSGVAENCHGRGPFFRVKDNGATSCLEIGRRQFAAAKSLYDGGSSKFTPISGTTVKAFHTFQNMEGFTFRHPNGTIVTTCAAALGNSFAAGTSDWPGSLDFKQGDNGTSDANPLWQVVRAFIKQPSQEQIQCQGEKPILLDVGEMHEPYDWSPNIVDIQVFRVGQFFTIVSPGEATTMAGRRWKAAIVNSAKSSSMAASPIAVLGGPANSYTHYITTQEEYNIQRYEGASTLYGPHTLNAYINLTTSYLPYLTSSPPSSPLPAGPTPPDNRGKALSFITGVVFDSAGLGRSYGDVITAPPTTASKGSTVSVTFVAANPRNDLRLEKSYATVEKKNADGTQWSTVRDDSDWDLIFNWKRTSTILATSEVTIQWVVPSDVESGTYRIRYFGAAKALLGGSIDQISGVSGGFVIG